jgi:hypothetical protein
LSCETGESDPCDSKMLFVISLKESRSNI